MAVIFNIKCGSKEEMNELRNKFYEGLNGSPAFVNNEIAICDLQEGAFTLIIGNNNVNDIDLDVHSSNLLER